MTAECTADELVARVRRLATDTQGTRPVLVGIDGRGGAGKSTLAHRIAREIDASAVVHMDDLYLSNGQRQLAPTGHGTNYDRPRLVAQILAPLRAGDAARYQRYDWDSDALAEWIRIEDLSVVVIEGVTAIADDVASYFDLTVWVETPADLCLQRGVERDGEAMRAQWSDIWLPGDDAYRAAQRPDLRAHVIVSGSGS